jgi:hypothetical protein
MQSNSPSLAEVGYKPRIHNSNELSRFLINAVAVFTSFLHEEHKMGI